MIRIFLTCALAGATALAQTTGAGTGGQTPASPGSPRPSVIPQQVIAPDNLPPDAVVITIHGICPASKNAEPAKSDSCVTTITKEKFNLIVAGVAPVNLNPVAARAFAQNYVQVLALAAAGDKAGLEKDPLFQELLAVMRSRAMAETYRRSMTREYSAPKPEELEAYYRQNLEKYERLQIDRVFIPNSRAGLSKTQQEEFTRKAQQVATEMRERAARGEDVTQLQSEAYGKLGLASPPKTDLGIKTRNFFARDLGQKIWALKTGEVTAIEPEQAGFSFYKLRARNALPLSALKETLVRELSEKNAQAAVQKVIDSVHSELNDQFFNPHPAGQPPKVLPVPAAPPK
jgi:hypothetical protein